MSMQTLILDDHMPKGIGGRPQRIGTFCADHETGKYGIFCGYNPKTGEKVVVTTKHLEKLLEKIGGSYKLSVIVEEQQPAKEYVSHWIEKFIPQKVKDRISEQALLEHR